ncbi:Serine/threonine-protein kinase wnk1 [Chytridiales sp. JEL 0842]|nr:Serine/threonine-protein kinase wnk1 [Chytridiales sp. JEL 0842]
MTEPIQTPPQTNPSSAFQHQAVANQDLEDRDEDDEENRVVETDPSGRFARYAECLGKGAYKEVFKAFDEEEGVEVAWNQLRVDHLQKKEAQRILSEIQILRSIRNDNIINLYDAWAAKGKDGRERVMFITELMTSGTLKAYLKKSKYPVKPKCENIFINGNNGQAKIGDLGLAIVKSKDHVSSVLGTPEFMAPELYDENYDEKVDIYAFGMVVIEIVTKEYPYSECTNQAQIYKKVTSGIRPGALQKVTDPDIKEFIDMCINFDSRKRPSAYELLHSPFLNPVAPPPGNPSGSSSSASLDNLTDHSPAVYSTNSGRTSVVSLGAGNESPISEDGMTAFGRLSSRNSSLNLVAQGIAAQTQSMGSSGSASNTSFNSTPDYHPSQPSTSSGSAATTGTASTVRPHNPPPLPSDAPLPPKPPMPKKVPSETPNSDHAPSEDGVSDTYHHAQHRDRDRDRFATIDTDSQQQHPRTQSSSPPRQPESGGPVTVKSNPDLVSMSSASSTAQTTASTPAATSASKPLTSASSTNTNTGSTVQLELIERVSDTVVVLRMLYGAPGHDQSQEIKFPFNLPDDTATDVVSEMVKENLIEARDEQLARRKLEEKVKSILLGRVEEAGRRPSASGAALGAGTSGTPPPATQTQGQQQQQQPSPERTIQAAPARSSPRGSVAGQGFAPSPSQSMLSQQLSGYPSHASYSSQGYAQEPGMGGVGGSLTMPRSRHPSNEMLNAAAKFNTMPRPNTNSSLSNSNASSSSNLAGSPILQGQASMQAQQSGNVHGSTSPQLLRKTGGQQTMQGAQTAGAQGSSQRANVAYSAQTSSSSLAASGSPASSRPSTPSIEAQGASHLGYGFQQGAGAGNLSDAGSDTSEPGRSLSSSFTAGMQISSNSTPTAHSVQSGNTSQSQSASFSAGGNMGYYNQHSPPLGPLGSGAASGSAPVNVGQPTQEVYKRGISGSSNASDYSASGYSADGSVTSASIMTPPGVLSGESLQFQRQLQQQQQQQQQPPQPQQYPGQPHQQASVRVGQAPIPIQHQPGYPNALPNQHHGHVAYHYNPHAYAAQPSQHQQHPYPYPAVAYQQHSHPPYPQQQLSVPSQQQPITSPNGSSGMSSTASQGTVSAAASVTSTPSSVLSGSIPEWGMQMQGGSNQQQQQQQQQQSFAGAPMPVNQNGTQGPPPVLVLPSAWNPAENASNPNGQQTLLGPDRTTSALSVGSSIGSSVGSSNFGSTPTASNPTPFSSATSAIPPIVMPVPATASSSAIQQRLLELQERNLKDLGNRPSNSGNNAVPPGANSVSMMQMRSAAAAAAATSGQKPPVAGVGAPGGGPRLPQGGPQTAQMQPQVAQGQQPGPGQVGQQQGQQGQQPPQGQQGRQVLSGPIGAGSGAGGQSANAGLPRPMMPSKPGMAPGQPLHPMGPQHPGRVVHPSSYPGASGGMAPMGSQTGASTAPGNVTSPTAANQNNNFPPTPFSPAAAATSTTQVPYPILPQPPVHHSLAGGNAGSSSNANAQKPPIATAASTKPPMQGGVSMNLTAGSPAAATSIAQDGARPRSVSSNPTVGSGTNPNTAASVSAGMGIKPAMGGGGATNAGVAGGVKPLGVSSLSSSSLSLNSGSTGSSVLSSVPGSVAANMSSSVRSNTVEDLLG